ncbi:MAG TPA: hypothetical protein VKX96_03590 [Chloroflexota bacterium]|nr:hypothetical protein [Chloroflexota bacterium]
MADRTEVINIHISELIFNVKVKSGQSGEGDWEAASWPDTTVPATEALPPLESVIARTALLMATPRLAASLGTAASSPMVDLSGVDPRALAERVYRLMRDELELARERE